MEKTIRAMLDNYQCQTDNDFENALKEIMQQVALVGLWRAKFFEHAAFYGGTALRILYQLDRYSEDLDFSLLTKDTGFNLASYLNAIESELEAFGFTTSVSMKEKSNQSAIQSAFLKANTLEHLIRIEAPAEILQRSHGRSLLKIKLEVDTTPPLEFSTEQVAVFQPIPFWVKSFTLPSLFAGKICAVLLRQWQKRVKGRDWYDFLWFIQRGVPVDLKHLEQRLRDYGFYEADQSLGTDEVKQLLHARIDELDIELAKEDIIKFIRPPSSIEAWSRALFHAATDRLKMEEKH
ncbi:MAG: hypothetical protein CMF50_01945 [Legionellales bacterium]|nr:hypothetical protein [Legionellales bacterium]|tara:strand:- start:87332 stop:88207 length:876 start_codon:yes stop_codon:yes gene_type:complete